MKLGPLGSGCLQQALWSSISSRRRGPTIVRHLVRPEVVPSPSCQIRRDSLRSASSAWLTCAISDSLCSKASSTGQASSAASLLLAAIASRAQLTGSIATFYCDLVEPNHVIPSAHLIATAFGLESRAPQAEPPL
jgi:hypothetical protein